MATIEYKLPEIGEGVTEAEILQWLVGQGDSVGENTPLVEVMTDKATVEIPSDVTGVVTELKWVEGDVVPIGAVLMLLDGDAAASAPGPAKKKTRASRRNKQQEVAQRAAEAQVEPAPAAAAVTPSPAPAPVASDDGPRLTVISSPPRAANGGPVLAAPLTRKLARELGIELEDVPGSGRGGRVTPDDVTGFAARARKQTQVQPIPELPQTRIAPVALLATPAPLPISGEVSREVEVVKLRGLRRKIATAMNKSVQTAAHFSYVDEVDVTRLVQTRNELKPIAAERGVRLSYLPFIIKAVVRGLKAFPMLNASLLDDAGEIHIKKYYNIGIAVATEAGLIVPVVKDVDRRGLLDLASEIQRVSTDARAGKSRIEDVSDGTFTITSAGNIGGLFATPIINHPEVAIVGVHVIKKRPVVDDAGAIVVRDMMYLSISLDHRVVDGAECSHFMNVVIDALQTPATLLLEGI